MRAPHIILLAGTIAIAACAQDPGGDQDFSVRTETLQVSKTGDLLVAQYTGADVAISVTARRTAADTYVVDLVVGTGAFTVDIDDQAGIANVAGGLDFEDAHATALFAFATEFYAAMPDRQGVADKVYRVASLYAKHPVGMPVEARQIVREGELRDWSSLCWEYYTGSWYTGTFDYECSCSWGFCNQCGGSWGSTVGGWNYNNGCFALCGAGCDGSSDYTRDCGNHDACVNAGKSSYQCSDEWSSASDDYMFAPNC